jgi:hypothetical protein
MPIPPYTTCLAPALKNADLLIAPPESIGHQSSLPWTFYYEVGVFFSAEANEWAILIIIFLPMGF